MVDINQNLGDLMKEAQKMQSRMQEAQEQLTQMTVTGVAGPVSNPMLSVTINGRYYATSAYVNPALREDLDMLPDLITAAFNDAVRQVEKESKKKINELTASLNIPTGFLKEEDK
jgi:nucleoid-associated protein EbfC